MRHWHDRPQEEAYLLNPAFCALTISAGVRGYASVESAGMPFPLAFLVLPVVLHKQTRDALPRSVRTYLATWIEDNPDVRIGFADRARALVPFVREGLLLAFSQGEIALRSEGRVAPGARPARIGDYLGAATDEVRSCIRKAEFVGRWLARAGTVPTIVALWGVRP